MHKISLILFTALQIAIKWQLDCVCVCTNIIVRFTEYIQHKFAV